MRSLAAGQYYAHPRNQFWRLVGETIARPDLAGLSYGERLAVLDAARIGLWDVYASAQRPGSLDSAIRAGEHAALADLIATLPDLRAIAFNGRAAAKAGRVLLADLAIPLIDLPSSSPANAAMPVEVKAGAWLRLRDFLS